MRTDHRLLARAAYAPALAAGLLGTLIAGGAAVTGHPAFAQETPNLTTEQRVAATALEGAFMRIADTASPATVRISSISALPRARRRSGTDNGDSAHSGTNGNGGNSGGSGAPDDNSDGDDSSPFSQFFGGQGGRFSQRTPAPSASTGSGVIFRPDGWILTNDHVVENSVDGGKVKVILSDNTEYAGKVYRDPSADLAVIKINPSKPLPFVKLADSSKLHVGQWAVVIGSPYSQQNSMTTGIVSALHRNREIPDEMSTQPRFYTDLIQTDAAINPGNSGGPVLNINGELIGIAVAMVSDRMVSSGVGFAIPVNTAKEVADQLISNGKVVRASLGVVPSDIPPNLRERVGTSKGAYIGQVAADLPADKAGIQPGDIITRFGVTDVGDENALRNAITFAKPGTTVPITLLREGKTLSINATLVQRDDPPSLDDNRPGANKRQPAVDIGIEAIVPSAAQIKELTLPADTKGILVTLVQPGSPAYDAELNRNTIITAINGKPVATLDDLNAAVDKAKSGDVLALSVLIPLRDSRPNKGVVNIVVP